MWTYELVDVETNETCYREQAFRIGEAPTSKPFEIEHEGETVLVQWHPKLP